MPGTHHADNRRHQHALLCAGARKAKTGADPAMQGICVPYVRKQTENLRDDAEDADYGIVRGAPREPQPWVPLAWTNPRV